MTVVPAEVAEKHEKKKEPYMLLPMLAELSGSIHVGLAALGAAIGVGLIGMGAASAVGRNPGAATPILVQAILAIAFAEAIVFYALYLAPK
ncbi:MAG TPA: ATP synthase F0 subunit C [Chthoniobacterales bacterium]|jgi:F-type H+-transporting ATPase subunit c